MSDFKFCTKCNTHKPLQDFPFDVSCGRYRYCCYDCTNKQNRDRHVKKGGATLSELHSKQRAMAAEKANKILSSGMKTCLKCKQIKSVSEFNRHYSRHGALDGYYSYCKRCASCYRKPRQKIERIAIKKACLNCNTMFDTTHKKSKYCSVKCSKTFYSLLTREKYANNSEYRADCLLKSKLYERKAIRELKTKYIKNKLRMYLQCRNSEIPAYLIELKRLQLLLKRHVLQRTFCYKQ